MALEQWREMLKGIPKNLLHITLNLLQGLFYAASWLLNQVQHDKEGDFRDFLNPYVRLTRLDKPTGIWLLLLPCYWAILMFHSSFFGSLKALILFSVGAVAMRSAGCAWNDWNDRDLDPYVTRTQDRPLANNQLSPWDVYLTIGVCCFVAFLVWLCLGPLAKAFSLVALALAVMYPFAKRFTAWPQVILGLAFNSGIWIAWAHVNPSFRTFWTAFFLYIAGIFWTLAYDTVYAAPDREGDQALGIGSTALNLGYSLKKGVSFFYVISAIAFILAGLIASLHTAYFFVIVISLVAMLFLLQQLELDDAEACQQFFTYNAVLGWVICAGIFIAIR